MSPVIRATVPTEQLRTAVGDAGPDVAVAVWDLDGDAPWPRIDLVVAPYMSAPAVLDALQGTEVGAVQSQSIGTDGVAERLADGVVLCNAAGVHEGPTAELGVGLMIAVRRRIAGAARDQRDERWAPEETPGLIGASALVIGAGGVASALHDRLVPFEVAVTRVGRTARTDERGRVAGMDELAALLPTVDIVVLAVPLTDDTAGLADAAFLAAMRDGALLVNLARGPVVDTDALLAELRTGRLLAALDVTDPEPLPAGHPLWSAPGVLINPHTGGRVSTMVHRVAPLVRAQLDALRAGRPLRNVVG